MATWQHLDLSNRYSIEKFLESIREWAFELFIFLVDIKSLSAESKWVDYLETPLTNSLLLSQELLKFSTEYGTLLYASSSSALCPSRDIIYSAVKAGMAAAIRSLTLELSQSQMALSAASGLTKESVICEDMPPEVKRPQ